MNLFCCRQIFIIHKESASYMQYLSPSKVSPTPSQLQRGPSPQFPPRSPPPPTSVANFTPLVRRTPNTTMSRQVPTNLNYTIHQLPQRSFAPSNNKLDINLNINVNNDGSITASTGQQATPYFSSTANQFLNTSNVNPSVINGSQFPPFVSGGSAVRSLPIGSSLGVPGKLPQNPYISGSFGRQIGKPISGILGQPIGPSPNLRQPQQIISGQPIMGLPVPFSAFGHNNFGKPVSGRPIIGQTFPQKGLGQFIPNLSPTLGKKQTRPLDLPFGMLLPPAYTGGYGTIASGSHVGSSSSHINTTIQQERVYCVLCKQDYAVHDRQQHIKKHQRLQTSADHKIRNMIKELKNDEEIINTRPIVEPEEYNIQYTPNQFILEENILYSSPEYAPTHPSEPATIVKPSTGETALHIPSERASNVTYQGTQPSISVNLPQFDTRFTRNTFVSDEPSPAVGPSLLSGRDTIQSYDFRGSQFTTAIKPTTLNSPMTPIVQEAHDSLIGSNAQLNHGSMRSSTGQV